MNTVARTKTDLPLLLFRAFSEPLRLRILHLLRPGELCVCDVVSALDVPQPTASRHLGYLRRRGLVRVRKQGLWSYYRLAEPRSLVHRLLLDCLPACSQEMPQLAADVKRLAKCRRTCC